MGRTERVSLKAARFALVVDRIERFPSAARDLENALAVIRAAADALEAAEKRMTSAAFGQMLERLSTTPKL